MRTANFLAGLFLIVAPSVAQDAASTPPGLIAKHYEPDPTHQEIASPMLLEVSLGATAKRKSIMDMDAKHAWVATETAAYSCRSVRVRFIQIWRAEQDKRVYLRVVPVLSDHDNFDVNVVVSIVSDGKEIRSGDLPDRSRMMVNSLLAGRGLFDTSVNPATDFEFSKEEFAALFGPDRAPSVRLVISVTES
jgi:hypothetical protein